MKPRAFQDALERDLGDLGYDLQFRSIEYPYPIDGFPLTDHSLPKCTGGVWDESMEHPEDVENPEVSEYYGKIGDFVGKLTDEDIFVVHMSPITRAVLQRATNLRLIACCRGGPKNINLVAATERGIPVVNTPGRNSTTVAEFTVGLLLAHAHYIARGHAFLMQGVWKVGAYRDERVGQDLGGRTVGIVGLGKIGQETARMLSGFRVRLQTFDPYVKDEVLQSLGAQRVSLEKLMRESDFVVLSARLSSETSKMIGAREIAEMKPTAYLVNAGRGGLLDYDALRKALMEKRIAGAALDVYDAEPPVQDDVLLKLPNVTVTPHIGGASIDVLYKASGMLAAEIRRFLRGEPLQYCLNPEIWKERH
jgi:D-3-phosphoglycerate dehydrogenase